MKLTEKDLKMWNFIRSYAVDNGYLPCIREICDSLGYSSTSPVWSRMKKLETFGYIVKKRPDGTQYSVKGLKYVKTGVDYGKDATGKRRKV